ncbi:MAG: hypothetical protein M1837_000979 [Sclerophora amabilis]|nr:MAG: hypothetical protein M1837_000979 [Sclerophora amabilis]
MPSPWSPNNPPPASFRPVILSEPPCRGAYKLARWGDFEDREEDREEYGEGGFHPVHLGSLVGENERYRIMHKLGYGGFATVWLARDSVANRYVALKIMKARESENQLSRHLKSLANLQGPEANHPGKQYIAMSLDHFHIEGPNGSHLCLVLPVLGPRITNRRILEKSSGQAKRKMARQAAEGLEFLHANGVGHGDFKPSNILLQFIDLDSWTEQEVFQRFGEPKTDPVVTASGEAPGPAAPSYIVRPCFTATPDQQFLKDQIMIIDFGEAFDLKAPPKGLGTPVGYCSPELLFDNCVGMASDIWALACTLYEIRTGLALFQMFFGDADEVIQQIVQVLGRLPDPWWGKWEGRGNSFDDDGNPRRSSTTGDFLAQVYTFPDLITEENTGMTPGSEGSREIPAEEVEALSDLLRKMVKYQVEDRITVAEALTHPWFHQDFS